MSLHVGGSCVSSSEQQRTLSPHECRLTSSLSETMLHRTDDPLDQAVREEMCIEEMISQSWEEGYSMLQC